MAESLINIEVRGQTIEKKDYRSSSKTFKTEYYILRYAQESLKNKRNDTEG